MFAGQNGSASRSETVVRAVLGVGVTLLPILVTRHVPLGLSLDLQSCLDVPDQLACGDFSQDLVGGLCLAAGGVLALGGIGLAVVSRTAGRLGSAVAAYVVLLGIAIALVVP